MEAVLYSPSKHPQDTEDIALEFVEQEVGRSDFKNNWPKFKANLGDEASVHRRVKSWLAYVGIEYDPREIVQYLDRKANEIVGTWR